jgi:hypothetical protein
MKSIRLLPKGYGRLRARRLAVLAPLLLLLACGFDEGAPGRLPASLEEVVERLYQRAREAGEEVPPDAMEWAREDLERAGDWEYRVVRLESDDDAAIEARHAALGAERWEAFWVERSSAGRRIFLKRRAVSYLRTLPLSELGRLFPGA